MERKVVTKQSTTRRRVMGDDGGWADMQPFPRSLEQRFGDVVQFEDDFGQDFPSSHPSSYLVSTRPSRRLDLATFPSVRPMSRMPIPVSTGDVQLTETDFKVAVDVSNFDPEDIEIKIVDNQLTVHAKHEEKQDDHGTISREFTRRYTLPPDVEPTSVTSSLGQDGLLAIQAPRNPPPPRDQKIPIKVEAKPAIGGGAAAAKGGK